MWQVERHRCLSLEVVGKNRIVSRIELELYLRPSWTLAEWQVSTIYEEETVGMVVDAGQLCFVVAENRPILAVHTRVEW